MRKVQKLLGRFFSGRKFSIQKSMKIKKSKNRKFEKSNFHWFLHWKKIIFSWEKIFFGEKKLKYLEISWNSIEISWKIPCISYVNHNRNSHWNFMKFRVFFSHRFFLTYFVFSHICFSYLFFITYCFVSHIFSQM